MRLISHKYLKLAGPPYLSCGGLVHLAGSRRFYTNVRRLGSVFWLLSRSLFIQTSTEWVPAAVTRDAHVRKADLKKHVDYGRVTRRHWFGRQRQKVQRGLWVITFFSLDHQLGGGSSFLSLLSSSPMRSLILGMGLPVTRVSYIRTGNPVLPLLCST